MPKGIYRKKQTLTKKPVFLLKPLISGVKPGTSLIPFINISANPALISKNPSLKIKLKIVFFSKLQKIYQPFSKFYKRIFHFVVE